MKLKNILILCLAASMFAVTAFTGCGVVGTQCVLEAENAVVEPEYDDDVAFISRANSRSENITSGGKYVSKMYSGNTITWFFTAEKQKECSISIAVANALESAPSFTIGEGSVFSISLNGEEIDVPKYVIAEGVQYCDNWQVLRLGTLRVDPGINKIVYTALSDTEVLNVDYLSLSSNHADVKEHNHFWKSSSVPANCTENGYLQKTCEDCGYSYIGDLISVLGHKYGNYHYSDELMKMVAVCERCSKTITANTPDSKYFGEVYYTDGDFSSHSEALIFEAEDAYVCLDGGLNNGDSHIGKDDGSCNNPSGGKFIENISKKGNYIKFEVEAGADCVADLVFRMSNTLYSKDGIAELDPLGNYVYCTVNGQEVDFSFVSFPGLPTHSYYEWRYVVIKSVEFVAGYNAIELGPKVNGGNLITMPNTDVLKIFTDGVPLRAIKQYHINDVSYGEYSGGDRYYLEFEKEDNFVVYSGTYVGQADYVLTVEVKDEDIDSSQLINLNVNDATVNLENVVFAEGENTVILKDVPLQILKNTVTQTFSDVMTVTSVKVYSSEPLVTAYKSTINSEYDYLKNKEQQNAIIPSLIIEAEDADLGDSVSSRDGVELIEPDIYENAGKAASGNCSVGNFAQKGNRIIWRFFSTEEITADIVVMLASANYNSQVNGNTLTDNLQTHIMFRINGVAVNLETLVLTVDSIGNYYDWKAVTVADCKIKKGENEVVIEALGYGAPNMDVLYIYADGASLHSVD